MNTMAEPLTEAISQQDVLDTMNLVHSEIEATVRGVKPRQVIELAAQLRAAPRVFVAGAGRSGLALRMAAMRLMHLGLAVHVAGDATTPAISEGDLLLVASGSGTTAGVVQSVNTARGGRRPDRGHHHRSIQPHRVGRPRPRGSPGRRENGPRIVHHPPILRQPVRAGAVPDHRNRVPHALERG